MMPRKAVRRTALTLAALLLCSTLSAGCAIDNPLRVFFGPNATISLSLPLGLNGAPGLLNPFGIVQAWVSSLTGGSSTGAATTGGTSAAGTSTPGTGTAAILG